MKSAATQFETPYGAFNLTRYPRRLQEPLQAWNAADALLLEAAHQAGANPSQTLVVNDSQGALCTALAPLALWTDSAISALALQANEQANSGSNTAVIYSTERPPKSSCVLLRIPKHTAFLEYQLSILAETMAPGSTLYAAGMDKHLSPKTAALLEHYIGATQRHRGQQKARLFSAVQTPKKTNSAPEKFTYSSEYVDAKLTALPNVFSGDRLDGGSRLLLSILHQLAPAETLIDLGCGNGILGLASMQAGLAKNVVFADESAQAIASAKLNCAALFPQRSSHFVFHHDDGLRSWPNVDLSPELQEKTMAEARQETADLIICNPPFHLDTHVDEFAGRHLLHQCVQKLHAGGQLCLVANRHLHYQALLQRHFSQCKQIAANSKFNVYLCTKS